MSTTSKETGEAGRWTHVPADGAGALLVRRVVADDIVVPVRRVARAVTGDVEALERKCVVGRLGDVGRDGVVVGDRALAGLACEEGVVEVRGRRVEYSRGALGTGTDTAGWSARTRRRGEPNDKTHMRVTPVNDPPPPEVDRRDLGEHASPPVSGDGELVAGLVDIVLLELKVVRDLARLEVGGRRGCVRRAVGAVRAEVEERADCGYARARARIRQSPAFSLPLQKRGKEELTVDGRLVAARVWDDAQRSVSR